ncbi:hypothetical protein K435DRAFT_654085 [Dendrothele bispora CBS 962.96]|uniref:Uncharacterized protein n=1 Tax=Dendrothele bispora (strain CBS 962.96) TaxID=1314807 RepID=A0A4S8MIR2_DENBC|nr:hypothetical protein K435DRAFT_654085 [Dendrothele bispora CBS 962.96]
MESDISGGNYEPFWAGFTYTNIYLAMTPDVLHQLYQGVLVHLIEWVQAVVSVPKLDQRIQALPPSFGVRQFKNGISGLSQVSGGERKNIAKVLLGCLHGIGMADRGIAACRAILDFIYLAQYQSHDDLTLSYMETALKEWHKNRAFFIEAGVRDHFNIPKFHSLLHYHKSIAMLGTTDNFNTEMFERLHIDFAKEGWHASNKRDHFAQMVTWLCRQEKIACKPRLRLAMTQEEDAMDVDSDRRLTPSQRMHYTIAKYPPEPKKFLSKIQALHHAPNFERHLKRYVNGFRSEKHQFHGKKLDETPLPFDRVDVWHQFKLSPTSLVDGDIVSETVKALPMRKQSTNMRFDTVMVLVDDSAESTAVKGTASLSALF